VNMERTHRLGIPLIPSAPAIRGTCLLVLLGLELLALTMRFDTQGLTGAAPWWVVWLGSAPTGLFIGLAGMACDLGAADVLCTCKVA
jgi:hypothetical protein